MKVTTTLAVGERDGNVVLSFPEPIDVCSLDPQTAGQVGEAMVREAYKAKVGKVMPMPRDKSAIADQIRTRMVTRVAHIIRSMQGDKRTPGQIAVQVVDKVLNEAL